MRCRSKFGLSYRHGTMVKLIRLRIALAKSFKYIESYPVALSAAWLSSGADQEFFLGETERKLTKYEEILKSF